MGEWVTQNGTNIKLLICNSVDNLVVYSRGYCIEHGGKINDVLCPCIRKLSQQQNEIDGK